MRSLLRRVSAALMLLTAVMSLFGVARADSAVPVDTPDALTAALEDVSVTAIELQNSMASGAVTVQGTKTVYLNGFTWDIGGLDLSGVTADASAGGGYVLRTETGCITAVPDVCVFVAETIALHGAADGEILQKLSAGGTELNLYPQTAAVTGGIVTAYVRSDDLAAMPDITEITTDTGRYVPGTSGGMARVYAVTYRDIVDAADASSADEPPQTPSNVSAVNASAFTADDTALNLQEPTLAGYLFAGWTWSGQTALTPASGSALTIDLAGLTGLEVTAHWTVRTQGGGGGRTGAVRDTDTDNTETTVKAETAVPETETAQPQSQRLSRGTSATRVSFSDSDAQMPMLPETTVRQEKATLSWPALAAAGAAVLACAAGAAVVRRRRRRRRDTE